MLGTTAILFLKNGPHSTLLHSCGAGGEQCCYSSLMKTLEYIVFLDNDKGLFAIGGVGRHIAGKELVDELRHLLYTQHLTGHDGCRAGHGEGHGTVYLFARHIALLNRIGEYMLDQGGRGKALDASGNALYGKRATAHIADIEAEAGKVVEQVLHHDGLSHGECEHLREQHPLGGATLLAQLAQVAMVEDAHMGAVLIDHHQARLDGGDYIAALVLVAVGTLLGKHQGAVRYTLGQRKGLGLAMGAPVYVCAKNMERNTVTVGPNEALYSTTLLAEDWNWFPFPTLTEPLRISAKARYNQPPQPATVYPEESGVCRVVFDAPQRALTPGQAVVLYDGDMVVGGGTITKVL